jgi:GNAT superfamily N-acetyltransferase
MFAGAELARRLEAAEARNDVACAEAHQRLDPGLGAAVLEVAGGFAIFVGAESPLTHALGIGMYGAVRAEEIARMEAFYRERGVAASLDVCPLADASLVELLADRGYGVIEFNNVLVRPLAGPEVARAEAPVRLADGGEEDLWAGTVGGGFLEKDALTPQEMDVGRSIWHMPGACCYLAFGRDEVAGAGAMAMRSGLAILYADGTLLSHRGAGLQTALIRQRLRDAADAGCDLATASTLPGSVSQRNYERAGFQVAYTKAVLAR